MSDRISAALLRPLIVEWERKRAISTGASDKGRRNLGPRLILSELSGAARGRFRGS